MNPTFIRNKDFWSGVMLLAIGLAAVILARDYPFGTSLRMGPGYFPIVLSGVMVLFGIAMLVQGVMKPEQIEGNWSLRALCILPIATVIYGVLMEHAGFLPALIVLIVVSAYAGREFKLVEVLLLAAGITAGSWALFIWGLGLPYPLIEGL